ncbi:MAG: potassium-transporting ATPase subunit KdpA [Clostridium sp.]|uniref:potassium-transporting ATPase subunit KdpA n=1 Tax=Clostridium sp. TaxID=1506 RepID=UPI003F3C0E2B
MVAIQLIIFLIVFIILIAIVGKYISNIINFRNYKTSGFFDKIDNFIYKICGIKKDNMSFKEYVKALLISNFFMFLFGFIILKIQGFIPIFNSLKHGKNFSFSLAFNTAASFVTNTDLQHYAGASMVSNLTQMIVITFLMFTSAATGCAIASGFIRTVAGKEKSLGNFYIDFTRFLTRLLIPFAFVIGIILVFCGVPQSLKGIESFKTITGHFQSIMLGPIASLEAIKHLGTNGGGFFAANSAHPFANPTIVTNFIEMISMTILPGSFIVAFGDTVKNKKQSVVIVVALLLLVAGMFFIMYHSMSHGNEALQKLGLAKGMSGSEGQDLRFGHLGSSLFSTITTTFTTGSTNVALNAMNPMFIFAALFGMMLNTLFGGTGVGFLNIIMYVLLTVFICGLMVGRTPEFFGKKVEAKEIKLIALAIVIHPILVLFSTVITLLSGEAAIAGVHAGFHGFTQVLYEFTSASANNGSLMSGYMNNGGFFNIITGIIMLIGRFAPIILLLAVSVSLANKKAVPKTVGTFRTDNVIFGVMLIVIILVIGALTFLPVLGLGPITEHLRFLG